jgi:esterase/lipase superfamily enzyme
LIRVAIFGINSCKLGVPMLLCRAGQACLAVVACAMGLCHPLLAATPAKCSVEVGDGNRIDVTIPNQLRSKGPWKWSVERISLPGHSYSVTLARDPWQVGDFNVVARDAALLTLCTAVLQLRPAQVERAAFVDPYPAIDAPERERLAELRRVASQERAVAETESKLYVVSAGNDKLRRSIGDVASSRDTKLADVEGVNERQRTLIDGLRPVLISLRQRDQALRQSCAGQTQPGGCESAQASYKSVEQLLSDVVREGSTIPTAPAPVTTPEQLRPYIQPPPHPIQRDATLLQLQAREAELVALQKKYESLIRELQEEHDQLTKELAAIEDDLTRQTQFASSRESQYHTLMDEARAAYNTSANVSARLTAQCERQHQGYCDAAQARALMDSSIQRPIRLAEQRIVTASVSEGKVSLAAGTKTTVPEVTKVKVYFVTEREQVPGAVIFADHRSPDGKTHYGVASVTIPPNHEMGEIERPVWWKFEREDPQKHFTLGAVTLSSDDFFGAISLQLRDYSPETKEVFVFVHGFNNSFDEAIFRAAQISNDTGFDGVPIVYDWPSWSEKRDYIADKTAIISSVQGIEALLTDVANRTGATKINLIAHSMGNFGLLTALQDLVHSQRLPSINQLILAAPDIDVIRIQQIVPELVATKKIGRITLYASQRDLALYASLKANKAFPAGHVPPVTLLSGVDTVDASAIESSLFGLGHDYFATTRAVLTDISLLLKSGSPPPRMGLKRAQQNGATYWSLVPSAY